MDGEEGGAVAVVRWWKWAIWVKTFEDLWKRLAACDLKLNCHQDDQGELVEESMGMDYGNKYLLGRGCCCHIPSQIIENETSASLERSLKPLFVSCVCTCCTIRLIAT